MKSSDWTHNICWACWNKQHPHQIPHHINKVLDSIAFICCWCGIPTQSGILVREDPAVMHKCQHTVAVIVPASDR